MPHTYCVVESSWNVMAHCDAREGKWRGNWRVDWVASTLHTTSDHGVSSITTTGAHTSAATSRPNLRPRQFKRTCPFRRKTKSGFCVCATTFQMQSNVYALTWHYQLILLPLHQSDYSLHSLHSSELFQRTHLLISENRNKTWIHYMQQINKGRQYKQQQWLHRIMDLLSGIVLRRRQYIRLHSPLVLWTQSFPWKLFIRGISEKWNLWQLECECIEPCACLTHCADHLYKKEKKKSNA
jgi:hypothetical protein